MLTLSKLGATCGIRTHARKPSYSKVEANHTPLHPMLQNLAVLGGNDPHSYGVTSRRASMNTLGPKIGGDGWIRTTALFRGEIYSLVQSTTLPRLQKRVRARLQSLVSHYWEKCSGDMPLQNGTRYENRTRLSALKGQRPNR